MRMQYRTTRGTYGTHAALVKRGRVGQPEASFDLAIVDGKDWADDPVAPKGKGWIMIQALAIEGVFFWFWQREEPEELL